MLNSAVETVVEKINWD